MWNPCRSFSTLVGLAVEAIEAITFLLDFSDPADKIWAEACDRLADKEAEEEVAEPAQAVVSNAATINGSLDEAWQSIFRSGGHLKEYGPRPRIATVFPSSSGDRQLRVIRDRGLGPGERDGEWIDVDGDRWRYSHVAGSWQNKMSRGDIATTWYNVPALDDGSISAIYAPFTEVLPSSSADGLAHSPGPLAEDSPAGPEISGSQPRRAPQPLTCDDFMDAARAAREKGDRIEHPNFARHWHQLADRLEIAAMTAAPTRKPSINK